MSLAIWRLGGGTLGSIVEVAEIEDLAVGEAIIGDGAGAPAKVAIFDGAVPDRLILNADDTAGADAMGVVCRRNGAADACLLWDETNDRWIVGTTTADTIATTTAGTLVVASILVGDGSQAAPSLSFSGASTYGFYKAGTAIFGAIAGDERLAFSVTYLLVRHDMEIGWSGNLEATLPDLILSRKAAATLHLGAASSASPVAQTLGAQGSRGGTDTNVAGAAFTIRPSFGTGNAAAASLILQGAVVQASGTTQHTGTSMVEIKGVALGFYGAAPVAQQTGVAVTAEGIHAALVNLGLITA